MFRGSVVGCGLRCLREFLVRLVGCAAVGILFDCNGADDYIWVCCDSFV
ncbi:MAG: hypothetical protein AB8U69_03675 [Anaplasma ovis]|nr:hypothetical protein [Anaplasma ovis]